MIQGFHGKKLEAVLEVGISIHVFRLRFVEIVKPRTKYVPFDAEFHAPASGLQFARVTVNGVWLLPEKP